MSFTDEELEYLTDPENPQSDRRNSPPADDLEDDGTPFQLPDQLKNTITKFDQNLARSEEEAARYLANRIRKSPGRIRRLLNQELATTGVNWGVLEQAIEVELVLDLSNLPGNNVAGYLEG